MKKILITFIICHLSFAICHAAGIGTWKAYMAYHDVTDVVKAGKILYVLASNDLYSYNENDKSITTYDKVNGLNDTYISQIAWNNAAKRLVIVYSNQNIDLLDENGNITNISDIYNYTTTDNKTINSIYMSGKYAYLSTGFGIIKLNVADAEISDTYNLGFNVNWSDITNNYLNAYSSAEGKYSGLLTTNLLDKNNWTKTGNFAIPPTENKDSLIKLATTLVPDGPKYNYFGFLKFYNGKLYTCGGGWGYNDLNRPGTIQILYNDTWQIYEDNLSEKTGIKYRDVDVLDIDPKNSSHVFASGISGIYEFNNGNYVRHWTNDNTNGILHTATTVTDNNKEYVSVNALKYNREGNLWGFNSISPSTSLFEYTSDGKWEDHHKESLMYDKKHSLENVVSMIEDSRGLIWFCNNHWNKPSLYAYQPSTNALNSYISFINEDGNDVAPWYVRCVIEDDKKNIWIGTNFGPLYLEPSQITASSPVFQQYKVPRNDGTELADYLLSGVDISCIAVDGAGRKWFGTNGNGAYLISEDNNTQIHHFLSTNSDLLSDNIESIAINPSTGEVFFGTDKGLCSYMSDATETIEKMDKDVTYAYPNPVKPGYTGPITITGLSYNADVKIVTSNGILVNEGKSTGGSYVWNGKDQDGKRVASGIYMVETATAEGKKGIVCKIAVIN